MLIFNFVSCYYVYLFIYIKYNTYENITSDRLSLPECT